MKKIVVLLLVSISLISCDNKTMTLEELEKASSWTSLGKGVDYISIKDTDKQLDSIDFDIKSLPEMNKTIISAMHMDSAVQRVLKTNFAEFMNKIPRSKKGYLRIHRNQMPKADTIKESQLPDFPLAKKRTDKFDYIEYNRY